MVIELKDSRLITLLKQLLRSVRHERIKKKLNKCGTGCTFGKEFVISMPECIDIGNDVHVGNRCQIRCFANKDTIKVVPNVRIEDNVTITDNCYISCLKGVYIGKGTLLGINVFITDNFHGTGSFEELNIPPNERALSSKGSVVIGKNVWIGRNVCVMPGVTIGDGAVIGANAVVTGDIPENAVAVGLPARVIRVIKKEEVR